MSGPKPGEAFHAKPLHAQVAEALGWGELRPLDLGRGGEPTWYGKSPLSVAERGRLEKALERGYDITLPYESGPQGPWRPVPRFDTDLSVTGPLIEQSQINLLFDGSCWVAGPSVPTTPLLIARNVMPLVAACSVLLQMAEAGRLNP